MEDVHLMTMPIFCSLSNTALSLNWKAVGENARYQQEEGLEEHYRGGAD